MKTTHRSTSKTAVTTRSVGAAAGIFVAVLAIATPQPNLMAGGLLGDIGDVTLMAGHHVLAPNSATQKIDIFGNNASATPVNVNGMNFIAQIGNGGAAAGAQGILGTEVGPSIFDSATALTAGTPFASGVQTVAPEAPTVFPQLVEAFVDVDTPFDLPSGTFKLGSLQIDTTGFDASDGPWLFDLKLDQIGAFTRFTTVTGAEIVPVIQAGSITIDVPEPEHGVFAVGLACAGWLLIRRARAAKKHA